MPTAVTGPTRTEVEFEEIFREHYRFVYRTAFSVTGSPEDAEDILQTIFLRLIRREVPLELRKHNLKAYLYRAAINLALDTMKLRNRHVLTGDLDRFDLAIDPSNANAAAGEALQKHLLDAVARLNPRAIEILVLRYVHDYSDAQIAAMLGTSRGTIAVSLYRSRARIKKYMRRFSGEKR